jgi:hypothetical protein
MSTDKKTLDICEMDLAGPVPAKPTARELAKARAASFKERHGVQAVTVHLPEAQAAAFDAYIAARNKKLTFEKRLTKSAVISKLIATQLLRTR